MKNPWFRKVLGGLSFTSALFIFQACYGTPQDIEPDVHLEGKVVSGTTGLPIKGIKVVIDGHDQYDTTNDSGAFSMYTYFANSYKLLFQDIDFSENGTFSPSDTIIPGDNDYAFVNVRLNPAK